MNRQGYPRVLDLKSLGELKFEEQRVECLRWGLLSKINGLSCLCIIKPYKLSA